MIADVAQAQICRSPRFGVSIDYKDLNTWASA
jgi:hypothetical protein